MLYGLVMCIHILVSFALIGIILLQAGKGGLAESFGGGAAQSVLGTSAGSFLTKATTTCAVMFMITCVSLTVLSSHRGGSLMRGSVPVSTMPLPVAPEPAGTPILPNDNISEAVPRAHPIEEPISSEDAP